MNWFSQNKFLTGFLLVLILAVGAAGYYLSTAYGKYKDAMDTFDREKGALASLEGKPLYPSPENVDVVMEQSKAYEEKVNVLQQALLKFQKPLDDSIVNTQFPNIVKDRTTQFLAVAKSKGVKVPEEFYMGFPSYRDVFPRPPAVALLHYQAQAIEDLLMNLVGAGVGQIVSIKREDLPVESPDYKAPEPAPVLEKYPLELVLSGDHESIRNFLNTISNDEDYFFIVRVLRIENSVKEGPLRGASGLDSFGPDGVAQPEMSFQDIGFPTEDSPEAADAEKPVVYDARIVLGQEKIQAYMVIDVLRFVEIK